MSNILHLNEVVTSCPVCGCDDFFAVFEPDVCKCRNCNVHFRSPRPREEDIIGCYVRGQTFDQWQVELKVRSLLWKKRTALIARYKPEGSLLDVGTGDGFFLEFAKRIFDVDATEVSSAGIDYAKARGHSVHHGTIFDEAFDGSSFDIITMWHVLEHLSEPGAALRRVRSLLKVDGVLFIAVPNEYLRVRCPLAIAGIRSAFPPHKFDEEIHLTHFTPGSLKKVLSQIFEFDLVSLLADDVYVRYRMLHAPYFHINAMAARLFGFHVGKAMVAVCKNRI